MNEQQLREKGFVYVNGQWFKQPEAVKGMTEAQKQTLVRDVPAALAVREERVGISSDEAALNKTEKRWLEILRSRGFAFVGIHTHTLKLAHDCRYTPDFFTVDSANYSNADYGMVFWEVKGKHIWEDSLIKIRTAARIFPFYRFVLAQWKDNQWTEKVIRP